jgi:hypothetical protein
MHKPKNAAIADSRPKGEIPEIFVKTTNAMRTEYARAHIRVKGGKYLYLAWKDGDRVRNFYMGQRKNRTLPTSPARGAARARRRGPADVAAVGQDFVARSKRTKTKKEKA